MNTFKYEPVYVKIGDSYGIDRSLYTKMFESHARWLESNDVEYEIAGFRWPELVSMLLSRDVVVEFELSIDDDAEAVMFRLFSGMATDA